MKQPDFSDFRSLARRRLPKGLFEYIDRGCGDETLAKRTRDALDYVLFQPRALLEQPRKPLKTTLWGQEYEAPLIIAPTALAAMVAFQGDGHLARAAEKHRIPFCVATQSVMSIEQIRKMAPAASLWFQLYVWKDFALSLELLKRVKRCDVDVLMVTVDTTIPPRRKYNERNGFGMPMRPSARLAADLMLHPRWVLKVLLPTLLKTGVPSYVHYPSTMRASVFRASPPSVSLKQNLSWNDVARIRENWDGPLIIKGITCLEDAALAKKNGADGIVVSLHGGRNFDAQPTMVDILPPIVEATGKDLVVMADGGVRSGLDVMRYLKLGAQAVLMGRSPLYAASAGKEYIHYLIGDYISEMTYIIETCGL